MYQKETRGEKKNPMFIHTTESKVARSLFDRRGGAVMILATQKLNSWVDF